MTCEDNGVRDREIMRNMEFWYGCNISKERVSGRGLLQGCRVQA